MKEWFLARGYHEIIVNNQIGKVVFGRDQSVKKNLEKVFSPPPIVSYRSMRKIKDYIVRSKSYPVKRKVGCERCCSSRFRFVRA